MLSNLDQQAFQQGLNDRLTQVKTALTNGDVLWNNSFGLFGQHGTGRKMLSSGLQWAGGEIGKGAVRGGGEQVADSIGWDAKKSFGDNATGMAQKAFGWDTSKGFMDNIQANPIKSGLIGAGVLAGGYGLGKSFGWWGNNDNNNNNQPQQNHFTSAYTTNSPQAPQALQKASEFTLPPQIQLPEPEVRLPSILNPSITVGKSIYDLVSSQNENQAPQSRKFEVTPEGQKAEKALADPRMQQYLNILLKDTYAK